MRLPRFRYSLRTLLIVVAIAAVGCWWLRGQYLIVQARQEFRQNQSKVQFAYPGGLVGGVPAPDTSIPWCRRLMGDEAVAYVHIWAHDESVIAKAKELFPEA